MSKTQATAPVDEKVRQDARRVASARNKSLDEWVEAVPLREAQAKTAAVFRGP